MHIDVSIGKSMKINIFSSQLTIFAMSLYRFAPVASKVWSHLVNTVRKAEKVKKSHAG